MRPHPSFLVSPWSTEDVAEHAIEDLRQCHAQELLPNITQAYRDAWEAETGGTIEGFFSMLGRASGYAYAVLIDFRVVAIFAVLHMNGAPSVGMPYFVASKAAERHAGAMVQRFRSMWDLEMHKEFETLICYLDPRNRRAARFLRKLGFTFHPPQPFGLSSLPFHKCTLGGLHV